MFNQSAKKSENEFKEAIKVYASKTDDALRSGANNMKDKVESYPTTSILIAVGIGFVLGFVSGRRWINLLERINQGNAIVCYL